MAPVIRPPASRTFGLLRVFSLLLLSLVLPFYTGSADAQVQWSSPKPGGFLRVCFGKDRFVAVGAYGQILWSTNGSRWYAANSAYGGTYFSFQSVCYGNGYFVAVGTSGAIARSTDGKNWTACSSPTTKNLSDVSAGPGRFTAVGVDATILASTDTNVWTSVGYSNGSSSWPYPLDDLCAVQYASGVWVALEGNQTGGVRSTDGVNWTRIYSGSGYLKQIIHDGTRFVAVSTGGAQSYVSTSTDGITWVNRAAPRPLLGVAYGKGIYVTVAEDGSILSSADLNTWTPGPTVTGLRSMAFGKGLFASVGGSRLFSRDGIVWNVKAFGGPGQDYRASCFFKGRQIIAGKSGYLAAYEFQSETIVPLSSGTNADLNDIACSGTSIVAVGKGGVALQSDDGTTWRLVDSKTTGELFKVVFALGKFCAVGASGVITTSVDGKTWQKATTNTTANLQSVATNGVKVIVAAANQTMLQSSDLVNWSKTTGPSENLPDLTFGNGLWVGCGFYGTMWYSPDGVTWNSIASGHSGWLSGIAFGEGRFILATESGALRVSTDGITWAPNPAGLEGAATFRDVSYGGGRFFVVGDFAATLISNRSTPDLRRLRPNLGTDSEMDAGLYVATDEAEGVIFNIERSSNLLNWETVGIDQTVQDTGLLYNEPWPAGTGAMFYRARPAPVTP